MIEDAAGSPERRCRQQQRQSLQPSLFQPALEPARGAARAGCASSQLQQQPGSRAFPWKSISTAVGSDLLSPGRGWTALCWTERGVVTAGQVLGGSAPGC